MSPELCVHVFQVINNNGSAEFLVSTNQTFTVTPEFIGSRLLLKMKKMAERHLGVPIQRAVISVPAEFDERQRNYTVRAANLAGQYINCLITRNVNKGIVQPWPKVLGETYILCLQSLLGLGKKMAANIISVSHIISTGESVN